MEAKGLWFPSVLSRQLHRGSPRPSGSLVIRLEPTGLVSQGSEHQIWGSQPQRRDVWGLASL